MLTDDDIECRVAYHPPTEAAKSLHVGVRATVSEAMHWTEMNIPECREKSLAITKLEEYMFWVNAAIARNHEKL